MHSRKAFNAYSRPRSVRFKSRRLTRGRTGPLGEETRSTGHHGSLRGFAFLHFAAAALGLGSMACASHTSEARTAPAGMTETAPQVQVRTAQVQTIEDEHAAADALQATVTVMTDRASYRVGEPIGARIKNESNAPILAPAGASTCSLLQVEQFRSGSWGATTRCPPGRHWPRLTLPSGGVITGVLGQGKDGIFVVGPIVSGPTAPSIFPGNVRELPTIPSWEPGDPTWEVPRGGPPGESRLRLDNLQNELDPGSYRLGLEFTVEAAATAVHSARSAVFTVSE